MRIAFLNRGRSHPGGDVIALDETMAALRRRGHFCEETWPGDARLADGRFDLAHLYHCNFDWAWKNYRAVAAISLPFVVTPVYYSGPLLCSVTVDQIRHMLTAARFILPFSRVEAKELGKEVWGKPVVTTPIPNGTGLQFISDAPMPARPIDVLCVAARHLNDKGNDRVLRAWPEAKAVCGVPYKDMPVLYRKAKVFVCASDSERMSLTIGEALCSSCRVLATKHNWGNEWYPGLAIFDPDDTQTIRNRIDAALAIPAWDYTPNDTARRLTWDHVVEHLESIYRKALR